MIALCDCGFFVTSFLPEAILTLFVPFLLLFVGKNPLVILV